MKTALLRTLVSILSVSSVFSHVFVPKSDVARRHHYPSASILQSENKLHHKRLELLVRGGGDVTADYSASARGLFGNLIGPATFLAGSLVPLGFLAPPLPGKKLLHTRIRYTYSLLAVLSLCNEAAAIVYATIACNKLTEIASAPAESVFALIQRDYPLSWCATNVHFLLGLFGFLGMIGVRAYMCFPSPLNTATAGIAISALLGMCSVVNRGVNEGDGLGHAYGSSIVTLVTQYQTLLLHQVRENGGILATASIVVGLVSFVFCIKAIVECGSEKEEVNEKKQKKK